jgi:hypothetical protein
MFTQLREILYTDSQDMLKYRHLPLHHGTTIAAQMAALVPEIMDMGGLRWFFFGGGGLVVLKSVTYVQYKF